MQQNSDRNGSGYADTNGICKLTDDLCGPDSELNGERRDELYVDGWIKRYTNCRYPGINNHNNLYGNGNHQRLQQYGSIYGNGESFPRRECKLTDDLCRSDSQLICNGSDKLYLDGWFSSNSNTNDTCLEQYDDLYCNGNTERLYRNSGIDGNGHILTKRNGHIAKHLFRLKCHLTG